VIVYAQTQMLTQDGAIDGTVHVLDATNLAPGITGTLSDANSGPWSIRVETVDYGSNTLRLSRNGVYQDLSSFTLLGNASIYFPAQAAPSSYVPATAPGLNPLTFYVGGTLVGSLTVDITGRFTATGDIYTNTYKVWNAGNLTNLNQLTNGPGYISGITSLMVTNALGYTPYNSTNPAGYISAVPSSISITTVAASSSVSSALFSSVAGGLSLQGQAADGSTAVGAILNNNVALSTAGAKLLSIRNNSVEKAYFDKDGNLSSPYATYSVGVDAGPYVTATQFIGKNTSGYLLGQVADGATAVGSILGNNTTFVTAGAKIVSFRNYLTEKAYVSYTGLANFNDKVQSAVSMEAPAFNAYTSTGVSVRGSVADGAAAVAVTLNNSVTLATSGAKLLSIQNNGTEKSFFDKDGTLQILNGAIYVPNSPVYSGSAGSSGTWGTLFTIFGSPADEATAVGVVTNCLTTLTTAGAKLVSFRNNSVEKALIDKDGIGWFSSLKTSNGVVLATSGNPLYATGGVADGATAVGVVLNNNVTLVNAGAKLASFQNNGTEKSYIGLDGGINIPAGYVTAYGLVGASASYVRFIGSVPDSGTAIATKIGNSSALATSGAKIVSFYSDNQTTEKAYIDKDGLIYAASNCQSGSGVFASANGTVLSLSSSKADGATNIGTVINTSNAFSTAGAKLISFQNNSIEKAYIDKDGQVFSGTNVVTGAGWRHMAASGNTVYLHGQIADGAAAVGAVTDNANSLVTAGAKLVSFRNATVEKAYIDKDGAFWGFTVYSNTVSAKAGNALTHLGNMVDGSTAIGSILDTTVTLATAGAKLLSVRNNTVEKAYIDYNGLLSLQGGISATGNIIASTALYAGTINGTGTVYGVLLQSGTAGQTTTIKGTLADSGSAVATVLDNNTALATAGAKIVSIRNNGSEKAYFDKDGNLAVLAGGSRPIVLDSNTTIANYAGIWLTAGGRTSSNFALISNFGSAGGSGILALNVEDSTTGKLSFRFANSEKAYIDFNGQGVFASANASGTISSNNGSFAAANSSTSISLRGNFATSGTAIAAKIINATALTTAGDKIVSFYSDNATTERAYIDYLGNIKTGSWATNIAVITYSASMTPDSSLGSIQTITATNATAFTINAPTNPLTGREMSIRVINTSGGALGGATWNGVFKMAAWVQPASATSTTITFYYDGTSWYEIGRVTGIPN
jgi:hypothetical protein